MRLPVIADIIWGAHLVRHRHTHLLWSRHLQILAGDFATYGRQEVENWNAFGHVATISNLTQIWTGDTAPRSQIKLGHMAIGGSHIVMSLKRATVTSEPHKIGPNRDRC
jgi:hypothetical protein